MSESLLVAGNTEVTRPENRAFFPALDGLRAVAFLMVFAQHFYHLPWGWTGVNGFFVLSGFLITGILFDSRDAPHRARTFYIRRTLRIFPLYYGIFLLLLVSQPLFHWQWSIGWAAWPLYLGNFLRFLTPLSMVPSTAQQLAGDAQLQSAVWPSIKLSMGHFWSLCVEEQFYLVWPWIVFQIRSRRALLWLCGVVVVAMPLVRVLVNGHAPGWMLDGELLYRVTPFQLDSLLLGGLISLLYRGSWREQMLKLGHAMAWVLMAVAVVYCARTFHVHEHNWRMSYVYPTWRLTWGLTFINLLSAALILSVLRPGGFLYRVFCLPPLRWLGRISYGAYVFHGMLHFLLYYLGSERADAILLRHGPIFAAIARMRFEIGSLVLLGCTLLISWLSFRFFEGPIISLKNRWAPSEI